MPAAERMQRVWVVWGLSHNTSSRNSNRTSYNLLHACPSRTNPFKYQMHRGKAEVLFMFLYKRPAKGEENRYEIQTVSRSGCGHSRRHLLQVECARCQQSPSSQHDGFSTVMQQHPHSYLTCFPTNILLCSWICSRERGADLPCIVHTFFPSSQVCLISKKQLHYFPKLLTKMGNQHTVIPLQKSYCAQTQLV